MQTIKQRKQAKEKQKQFLKLWTNVRSVLLDVEINHWLKERRG